MENNIILSICIPTYNRAESLSFSLKSVFEAIKNFENKVEIVVSNNCSTDLTLEVLERYKSYSNFKFYTNLSNIGFNLNYFKLINEYSTGKYCWIIGDDDFLEINAVRRLLGIVEQFPEIDFICTNYIVKPYQSIIDDLLKQKEGDLIPNLYNKNESGECLFNDLLNKDPRSTNILLTYISASIFNRKLIKDFDKKIFNKNSWVTFRDLFPHSYMFATVMKNKRAYYFSEPLIIAAIQNKEWDANLSILYLKYMPELSKYYKSIGYTKSELSKTNEVIAYSGIISFFRYFKFNKDSVMPRLIFLKKYMFSRALYKSLMCILKNIINKKSITEL